MYACIVKECVAFWCDTWHGDEGSAGIDQQEMQRTKKVSKNKRDI